MIKKPLKIFFYMKAFVFSEWYGYIFVHLIKNRIGLPPRPRTY